MLIDYKVNASISTREFVALLHTSQLAERRPVDDSTCIDGMLQNSNLVISAWDKNILVGVARAITDFHYACYLSDLAVAKEWRKRGLGGSYKKLTQEQLGPRCKLILTAASDYYPCLGYEKNDRCWVLQKDIKYLSSTERCPLNDLRWRQDFPNRRAV